MEWATVSWMNAGGAVIAGVLAVVVLWAGPDRSWNRAFAVFLVIFAALRFAETFGALRDDGGYWHRVHGYFALVDDLALLYFVALFPRRVSWLPKRAPFLPFLLVAASLVAWYVLDREALLDRGGPLVSIDLVFTGVAYTAVPLLLVWHARNDPAYWRSILIVATALPLWYVSVHPASVLDLLVSGPSALAEEVGVEPGTVLWRRIVLAGSLVLALAQVVYVARRAIAATASERSQYAAMLGLLVAAFGSSVLVWQDVVKGYAVAAFWFVVALLLIAYSIVRHQFIDIDLKVKRTLDRGTVAAIFVAVFFVVSVVAENFLTDRYGWALGGIGAGLLLFALAPLQRLGERVSDAVMPAVTGTPEYFLSRKLDIYRTTLESLLGDGQVTAKERGALLRLQESLELDAGAANRVELEVLEVMGVDRRG